MWAKVDGRDIVFTQAGPNHEDRWVWVTQSKDGGWQFSPSDVTEVGGKDYGEAQKNAKERWPNIDFHSTPMKLVQMRG